MQILLLLLTLFIKTTQVQDISLSNYIADHQCSLYANFTGKTIDFFMCLPSQNLNVGGHLISNNSPQHR